MGRGFRDAPELHAAYLSDGGEPGAGHYQPLFDPDYEQNLRASAEKILAPAPPELRDESTLRMYIKMLESIRQKAEEELAALIAA